MGNNVSLIAAVTQTNVASSMYNSNQNALNNANSYTFTVGSLSQIAQFEATGSGTYNTGVISTGANIAGAWIVYRRGGNTFSNGFDQVGIFSLGNTTVKVSASFTGRPFTCTVYKL